jgi:hypothetical protein
MFPLLRCPSTSTNWTKTYHPRLERATSHPQFSENSHSRIQSNCAPAENAANSAAQPAPQPIIIQQNSDKKEIVINKPKKGDLLIEGLAQISFGDDPMMIRFAGLDYYLNSDFYIGTEIQAGFYALNIRNSGKSVSVGNSLVSQVGLYSGNELSLRFNYSPGIRIGYKF